MRSKTTRQFRNLLSNLPDQAQRQAQRAYELFRDNPAHPGLQFKQVRSGALPVYSVRVGLHYRALGIRRDDYIV